MVDIDQNARRLTRPTPSASQSAAIRDALLDAAAKREPPPRRRAVGMVAVGALCAAVACVVAWVSANRPVQSAPTLNEFRGVVLPSVGARYERIGMPGRETIELHSGVMRFEVSRLAEHEFFDVVVGVERVSVRGTVFHVVAVDDTLVSVDVVEGAVDVHARDVPVVVLRAGTTWRAATSIGLSPAAERQAAAPLRTVGASETPARPPRRRRARVPRSDHAVSRGVSATDTVPGAIASSDNASNNRAAPSVALPGETEFRDGWTAFDRGDYGRAIVSLRRGCKLSIRGEFVEDSCFWLAVASERAGRAAQAIAAYRSFVSRFEAGARADESRLRLGALLFARGDRDEAVRLFRVVARSSSLPGVRADAARALRSLGLN